MRYNTTGLTILNKMLDTGPYIIIAVIFIIAIASIVALLGLDVYTGQIFGEHLTQDRLYGTLTSLAGTGMILAASGFLMEGIKLKWDWWVVAFFAVLVICLQGLDSYFDASSVDIKRFGELVFANERLGPAEARGFIMFRVFVAGVSLVGEPLAMGMLLFFPAMKKYIHGLFADKSLDNSAYENDNHYQPNRQPTSAAMTALKRNNLGRPIVTSQSGTGLGNYNPGVPNLNTRDED